MKITFDKQLEVFNIVRDNGKPYLDKLGNPVDAGGFTREGAATSLFSALKRSPIPQPQPKIKAKKKATDTPKPPITTVKKKSQKKKGK